MAFAVGTDTSGGVLSGSATNTGGGFGGEGDQNERSKVSQALSSMSPIDQEALFRSYIDPQMTSTYDSFASKLGGFATKSAMSGLLNAVVPGLGILAKLTGATDKAYGMLQDATFSQGLAERLGISQSPEGLSAESMRGEDVLKTAQQMGIPQQQIDQAIQDTYGGTMANTAAGTAASYQQQALDYLMEREAIPRQFSEAAMQQMGGALGLPGGTGTQQEFLTGLQQSPMYQSIMGGQQAGEEAIMRQAGATGGLRSGNVQDALARYSGDLSNQALLQSYQQQMSGLGSMAGLSSYAPQIAQSMTGIGTTLAQGQIAEEQMEQAQLGQWLGLGSSVLQSSGGIPGAVEGIGDAVSWAGDLLGGLF